MPRSPSQLLKSGFQMAVILLLLFRGIRRWKRQLQNRGEHSWERRPWQGAAAYSDTKLHDVLLAFAVARRQPEVLSNALEPGWVPTKMGGPGAPDDLDAAHRTQVWLAVSKDAAARVSGRYFYHLRPRSPHPAVFDVERQEKLLDACYRFSGVRLPA